MREIKFRAWDKKIKALFPDITNELLDYLGDGTLNSGLKILQEDDFILMQFTGLHDKNGKEIYEGDIVSVPSNEVDHNGGIGFVVFHGGEFRISFSGAEYYTKTGYNEDGAFSLHWWIKAAPGHLDHNKIAGEVIGNVWENQELVK